MLYLLITTVCWCVFYGYWIWKARETKDNIYIQGIAEIVIARIWLIAIFALLYCPQLSRGWLGIRILPMSTVLGITADVV